MTSTRRFLARIVQEGPMPAVHGVVRWRACDRIMRLYEEFGLSVSDDTIYRALKDLGFSHENPCGARCGHGDRGLVPEPAPAKAGDEMRVGQKKQAHRSLGQHGLASAH